MGATLYEPAPGGAIVSQVTGVDAGGNLVTKGATYTSTGQIALELHQQVNDAIEAAGGRSAFGEGLAELVTNPVQFFRDGISVAGDVASGGLAAIDSTAKLVSAVALLAGVGLAAFLAFKVSRVLK